MNTATLALADQAAAAASEAGAIMQALAERVDLTIREAEPGPVMRKIVAKLTTRLLAGQLTLCAHLSWSAPEPVHYTAWAAGKLRCAPCGEATARRIRGTGEDETCDNCHRKARRLTCVTLQLPPIIYGTYATDRPGCVPPILLHAGLCPRCADADGTRLPASNR